MVIIHICWCLVQETQLLLNLWYLALPIVQNMSVFFFFKLACITSLAITLIVQLTRGFSGGTSGKAPACQCRRHKRRGFDTWVRKIPWRRAWQSTPVFLPGESHGQRKLVGYSPQGHIESDRTEATYHARTINNTIIYLLEWLKLKTKRNTFWINVSQFCLEKTLFW